MIMNKNCTNNYIESQQMLNKVNKFISKAGSLFYQYRPCRLDDFTIYDLDNISHDVVYAQTPLNMNDPFDSQIGFSQEKIFEELIDLVLDALQLDENHKLILNVLIKNDLLGNLADVLSKLNELRQQIHIIQKTMHKTNVSHKDFILQFWKVIYAKLPKTIKQYFTESSSLIFTCLMEKFSQVEIGEEQIKCLVSSKEQFEAIKSQIITLRDKVYVHQFEHFLSTINISCFSASGWDNQLMWSHYANSYQGMCVEYDFTQFDTCPGIIQPINYSALRPTVSLKDLGITQIVYGKDNKDVELIKSEINIQKIIEYLCVKSPVWQYENEWRIINPSNSEFSFIDMPKVKSITLGHKMHPVCRQLLMDICRTKEIECYEIIIDYVNFKINRRKVDLSNNAYDIDLDVEYINLLSEKINRAGEKINEIVGKISDSKSINNLYLFSVNQNMIDMLSVLIFLKDYFIKAINYTQQQGVPKDTILENLGEISKFDDLANEIQNYCNQFVINGESLYFQSATNLIHIRNIKKQVTRILALLDKYHTKPWMDM